MFSHRSMIDTTHDFEDSNETDTTVQQYQEHFGHLYDLDFRLISIGRRERGARGRSRAGGGRQGGRAAGRKERRQSTRASYAHESALCAIIATNFGRAAAVENFSMTNYEAIFLFFI